MNWKCGTSLKSWPNGALRKPAKSANHVEIYPETCRIQRGSTTVGDFCNPRLWVTCIGNARDDMRKENTLRLLRGV